MSPVNFYPGALQWGGIAKETTYGTAVAAPTTFIPFSSVPKLDPKYNLIKDTGMRGVMGGEFDVLQGQIYTEFTYSTMLYPDSLFPHLVAMFGSPDTVTGTAAAPTGTLSTASIVGATTVSSSVSIPASTLIQIDTGQNAEIVTTTAVSGTGPYTITVPALAKAHASGVAITKVVQPFTHAESLYNGQPAGDSAQPPSYTGFLYLPTGKMAQIPGMRMADLKISLKTNEAATLSVTWQGLTHSQITATANTPSTVRAMNTSNMSISLGGLQDSSNTAIEIDFKRDTTPVMGATGSVVPVGIAAGTLSVSGSLDAIFQGPNDVRWQDFLTNVQPSLSVSLFVDNDSTHPFTIQMSRVVFTSAPPVGNQSKYMTIQSAFDAIFNATDALDGLFSPAQAKLLTTSQTAL